MDRNILDYKSDGTELAYLKFMDNEQEYHKVFSQDRIIYKSKNPHTISRFRLLGIPYKEDEDKIIVGALYVIKSFFVVELYKFYKDTKILKKYGEMFDKLYISNEKGGLYSYQLEFYIGYFLMGMDVNIYILPDSIHILNDGELDWLGTLFGRIDTHITVNFSELVEKTFSKKFKSKYTRILTTPEEMQILCEIEEKNPKYKKKQIKINFNPDETLRDLDLSARAPIDMFHEIDKELDFGRITKVKHNSKATHLELKKKISLKKDK